MTIKTLIAQLNQGVIDFNKVITIIEENYNFTPTLFTNGNQTNLPNTNNGSCKIFYFALLHQLNKQATLNSFGKFYAVDVLQHPNGTDHANIRNFMQTGWLGVKFEGKALKLNN